MKTMLDKIYGIYGAERAMEEETNEELKRKIKQEHDMYTALCNALPKKERALVEEYIEEYGAKYCGNVIQAYKDGFTAGVLLMIEIFRGETPTTSS